MGSATIYVRQSLDRRGDGLAIDRQLKLCRGFAERNGWDVTAEYQDNDRSATSGVERTGFEQLLASKPERIIVWHVDRLVRLTEDLERVINLGVNVHAVEAGHLDLSNPAGRAVARTVTAWATYEGEQKALRQRASNDQRAQAGRPSYGRRCFGYTGDGLTLVAEEAEHARWAVQQILAGKALREVNRELGDRGAVTTAGKAWTPTSLRRYLQLARLAGLRVHRGDVVGDGVWPALISQEDHVAVRAILSDPSRKPQGRPRTYLLSGIARCGQCGGKIYGRIERRGPIYTCESGAHLGRKLKPIDEYVEAIFINRLSRADAARALARPGTEDRVEELRTEQRSLTGRLDELAQAFAMGSISARQMTTASTAMQKRLDEISAAIPTLTPSPALRKILNTQDVAETWQSLAIPDRREIVGLLSMVTIHPAGRGAREFNPETVTVEWESP